MQNSFHIVLLAVICALIIAVIIIMLLLQFGKIGYEKFVDEIQEYIVEDEIEYSKTKGYHMLKRGFDIFIAGIGIFSFFPIFLVASIALWIEVKNPILWRKESIGYKGKPISVYKFRTIIINGETEKPKLCRVGSILYKTCLDSLPIFLSLLKGDVSVVGLPIQRQEYISEKYCNLYNYEKPGLFCLNMFIRKYGEEAFGANAFYLSKRSFLFDIKIIRYALIDVFFKR